MRDLKKAHEEQACQDELMRDLNVRIKQLTKQLQDEKNKSYEVSAARSKLGRMVS